ncbi:unnamed protein product, partial [Meganyctiphanes norvegica]
CQVFLSNSIVNASIGAGGFTGVIEMWFWAANGTNFTATYPRDNPADTFAATFQTLKTGWIKTTLDWPVGQFWEHMGSLSIPSVNYLQNGAWVSQLTVELGHTATPRMVVASSAPMIWIKQKSCDITSLDPKIFIGESSCTSYPEEPNVTTASPIPTAAAGIPAAPTLAASTTAPAVPTPAAKTDNELCSQTEDSSSNSSSIAILAVLLVMVSLTLILLSVYTYRLRFQLGITGANVSFQPLTSNGTTIPRSTALGSQNSLHDVTVPLH